MRHSIPVFILPGDKSFGSTPHVGEEVTLLSAEVTIDTASCLTVHGRISHIGYKQPKNGRGLKVLIKAGKYDVNSSITPLNILEQTALGEFQLNVTLPLGRYQITLTAVVLSGAPLVEITEVAQQSFTCSSYGIHQFSPQSQLAVCHCLTFLK